MEVQAQIRYNGMPATAIVNPLAGGGVQVRFQNSQRSIAPGQSVVFYLDDCLLGGGIITKVIMDT
jgi:tRNA-specific 2-thiouridylase